jgi:hypothetical protein
MNPDGYRCIMCKNQPLGYILGWNHPAAKLLNLGCSNGDLSVRERFFHDTITASWEQLFRERYGVKPAKGRCMIDRLLGEEDLGLMWELPGRDHYTLWEKDGKPALFTMQVYGMPMEMHHQLREFCIKHELIYRTESRSWYNCGVSILVV